MLYQKQTFTLPAAPTRITQTDWEIAVGLRTPGKLVRKKAPQVFNIRSGEQVALPNQWAGLTDRQRKQWLAAHDYKIL